MKTSDLFLSSPLRLTALSLVLAVSAFAVQTASAQPQGMMAGGEHRHGARGGEGMGHDMALASPRMMARMLDGVNATPEQRAQIQQLAEAARADMKAQFEAGRKLREDSAALFSQPTVDARAAEALRQQRMAQHDQASKRQMQLMLDISRVLTPEQRKLMAERMVQRRSMKERYQAEPKAAQ